MYMYIPVQCLVVQPGSPARDRLSAAGLDLGLSRTIGHFSPSTRGRRPDLHSPHSSHRPSKVWTPLGFCSSFHHIRWPTLVAKKLVLPLTTSPMSWYPDPLYPGGLGSAPGRYGSNPPPNPPNSRSAWQGSTAFIPSPGFPNITLPSPFSQRPPPTYYPP